MPNASVVAVATHHARPARRPPISRLLPTRAAWLDCLIAVVCILPLLLTAHLPLADLPSHLARQYIIRDWASSPTLQAFYYVQWALVPNLALEIFVLAARQAMSIDMAVRAFCIATVLLLFLGTRLVNRGLGGDRVRMYRVAPLLCYGGPFQYGFLSYCFGVGLSLLLFGLYLRFRTLPLWRLAAWLMPLSVALLLCHLVAFGLFAIAVGGCELAHGLAAANGDPRRLPLELLWRQLRPICCLVPVLVLFMWLSPTADHTAVGNLVQFSTLHQKARSLSSITMFASPKLEVALLALAAAGLAAALLGRVVRVHGVGLAVVAAMLVVWLLLPNVALGAAFIDYRMPWAISFFLLAGLVAGPGYGSLSVPFGLYFGALALARIGLIAGLWLSWEPTLAALDRALGGLPPGARLMVVEGFPPGGGMFRQPTLTQVASYAVARRQAFDPGMFANVTGQTLFFQPHFLELWKQDNLGESLSVLDRLAPDYDHVLVLVPSLARVSPLLPLACEVSGPNFELFKVVPSSAAPSAAEPSRRCPG